MKVLHDYESVFSTRIAENISRRQSFYDIRIMTLESASRKHEGFSNVSFDPSSL